MADKKSESEEIRNRITDMNKKATALHDEFGGVISKPEVPISEWREYMIKIECVMRAMFAEYYKLQVIVGEPFNVNFEETDGE